MMPVPSTRTAPVWPTAAAPGSRHETRGRELLVELGEGAAALGRRLGIRRGMAHAWLVGRKIPGEAARRLLEARAGIPAASWDEVPIADGAGGADSASGGARADGAGRADAHRINGVGSYGARHRGCDPAPGLADDDADRTVEADVQVGETDPQENGHATSGHTRLDLLEEVRAIRSNPRLRDVERLKAAQTEAQIVAMRARQRERQEERELDIEDLCVRHPRFQAMMRDVTAALEPFPEAARAVLAAIDKHIEERKKEGGAP